jgi:dTDP-4-amino-4,6-dideoxygalactose transaminase
MVRAPIYLSPPHLEGREAERVAAALRSNWVAPAGPELEAFEGELAQAVRAPDAVALSSGTAALHLALRLAGVGQGDLVYCPTFTFVACASAIALHGARPAFVDSDRASWNMDPALLAEELDDAARRGVRPAAVIVVHGYGQCADLDPLLTACDRHRVPLIEDAAEALGATYKGRAAGTLGRLGAYSFNGNKIVTASSGGALVAPDPALVARARFLAGQAKEAAPHYEHRELGYTYRMSGLLAAVGRVQLGVLDDRVRARRAVFERYRAALAGMPGLSFMPEAPYGVSTRWLSVLRVDAREFGAGRDDVVAALAADGIEARPVWKPLHRQPVFAGTRAVGGAVADALFADGLCLPSGSQLTPTEQDRVVERLLDARRPRL